MARMDYRQSLGFREPQLGEIVLFHPPKETSETPGAVPAIIHHIGDPSTGRVDLTVFGGKGTRVVQDVPMAADWIAGYWSRRAGA
jgi:hypothetical protein